jgi:hypothetical protein
MDFNSTRSTDTRRKSCHAIHGAETKNRDGAEGGDNESKFEACSPQVGSLVLPTHVAHKPYKAAFTCAPTDVLEAEDNNVRAEIGRTGCGWRNGILTLKYDG